MYLSVALQHRLQMVISVLTYSYALFFGMWGIDKFLAVSRTQWIEYVSPTVQALFPIPVDWIVYGMGMIQCIVSVMMVVPRTRQTGCAIATVYLILVAIDMVFSQVFISRTSLYLMVSVGSFALYQLLVIHNEVKA